MQSVYFSIVNATITDLRNPAALLDAADRDEPVFLTRHGERRYELRKVNNGVAWNAIDAGKSDWLTKSEADDLTTAINRSEKVLTDASVP